MARGRAADLRFAEPMSQHPTNTVLSLEEFDRRLNVAMFTAAAATDATVEENADGTGVVRGIRVFKAGTFADSIGERRTWTAEHLLQMVSNFTILRDGGQFPDVPQRVDHYGRMQDVVGYFADLTTDGVFLYADLHFTEPEALAKYKRGTYRGRSLEVGFYETNDEQLFWPVVQGVAWVGIPAVEGLTARYAAAAGGKSYTVISDKEIPPVATPSDDSRVTTFSVAGTDVSDFALVQAHIVRLEGEVAAHKAAAHEQALAGRAAFVSSLVTDSKIGAPQEVTLADLVADMSDAQYAKFVASYGAAPVMSLLAKHGNTVTNPDGQTDDDEQVTIDKETVALHRMTSLPDEALRQTASFRRLVAAGIEK